MGTDFSYPIGQAITDTSHALSGELGLDANTVARILRPWLLRQVPSKSGPMSCSISLAASWKFGHTLQGSSTPLSGSAFSTGGKHTNVVSTILLI